MSEGIDYRAWYGKVQTDIGALPPNEITTRAQQFVKRFPDCITRFADILSSTDFARPLEPFQHHPNFLLRFLLAEWRDEQRKQNRDNLDEIIKFSLERVQKTQAWRAGQGELWKPWGFKDIDDLYHKYKNTPQLDAEMQNWFPQRFFGHDKNGYPIHYEVLPNSFKPDLLRDMTLRRTVNNEHTLRYRELVINPPPLVARTADYKPIYGVTPEIDAEADHRCSNPRIGVTWIVDCRRLSIWQSASIYKTAQAMIEATQQVTSHNYPEQGHQALVVNLGAFWGSMYNLAMRVMPAQTQRTTTCFMGNEVLDEKIGWDRVPKSFKDAGAATGLTVEEEILAKDDVVPSARSVE